MAKCAIFGSANGIENLGDVLLLHCAMRNIKAAFPEVCHYNIQTNGDLGAASALADCWEPSEYRLSRSYSFDWSSSPWQSTRFRRRLRGFGRFPEYVYMPICFVLHFAAYFLGFWRGVSWLKDWKESRLVYFYGGSHFSDGFFWVNGFPMLLFALIAKREGVKLVFGPQQFGPQTRFQTAVTAIILKLVEYRVFFRNRECAELFGLQSRLTYDEVFVSDLYFSSGKINIGSELGVVNFRGSDAESSTDSKKESFLEVFDARYASRCSDWRIFLMSYAGFNDDLILANFFEVVESQCDKKINADSLVKSLSEASFCLSMSYHGCILALLAGVHVIPIVSGRYYAWKFSDFDRYCGHLEKIRWVTGVGWTIEGGGIVCQGEDLFEIRRCAVAHHFSLLRSVLGSAL